MFADAISSRVAKELHVNGRNHNKLEAYLIPYPIESFSRPILIEGQQTFIGRDPNGSIKIAGKTVSRQHAVITCENARFLIEDLDSQNGTYLNGNTHTKSDPQQPRQNPSRQSNVSILACSLKPLMIF